MNSTNTLVYQKCITFNKKGMDPKKEETKKVIIKKEKTTNNVKKGLFVAQAPALAQAQENPTQHGGSVVCVKVAQLRTGASSPSKKKYNDLKEWMADKNNVYIARQGVVFIETEEGKKERWPKEASPFANPYAVGKDGTREEVIEKFEEDMRGRLEDEKEGQKWRKALMGLKGKTLGCWCKPEPCHGDVLLKLIDEYSE